MSTKKQNQSVPRRHGGMRRGHGPLMGGKPKDFKKSMGRLLKFIRPFYTTIIITLILAIIGSLLSVFGPRYLGYMTTELQKAIEESRSINFEYINRIGLILVCLFFASHSFQVIQGFIMSKMTQTMSHRLRTAITKKINHLPLRYFDTNTIGDVLSRLTNDVDLIAQTLNQSLISMFTSITTLIAIIAIMISISPIMTLITLFTVPVTALVMSFIMKKSQKYFYSLQDNLGALNGHIEEIYSGHNVIKVFNGSKKSLEKFSEYNNNLYTSAYKSQFISGLMFPIARFIGNLSYVVVSIAGILLRLTIGDIQSFIIYIRRFNHPLSTITQMATTLQSTAAAAERVFEFLEEEEMEDESHKFKYIDVNKVKGEVEFKNVKFGYTPDKIVINNFSAKALPGQKIAIVGPTGAGKTTLVNLLMRFYEINDGDITIDGVSIKELTRENIHDLFGMVLQDTWLFNGTIKENLSYGKIGISDEEVIEACKIANVDHFIRSLPGGYNMMIDDESNISQGQRQLLTIARAIVKNAPMLILDEATSSVDTRTEIIIQNAMDQLMKGRTSFVIAHRLSTIKNADLILVVKDGNIIESGKHDDLLEKNGFYAELYNSMFEKIN
ncbi:TPA: ABC transporter ATP-binding protein [bacterium]|nr:ABC transporter ATP-binding protein [bacterium]